MTYRQYTQCVQLQDYNGSPEVIAAGIASFMSLISVIATGAVGMLASLWGIPVMLGIVTGALSFVRWWLYGRLVCLGGERCAIGMVVSVEPHKIDFASLSDLSIFDTDYSFNLLLPPHHIGDDRADIESDGFLGYLIRPSVPLPFQGVTAQSCESDRETAVLHCEFEGAGMYILYQYLKGLTVALGVATVAAVLCVVPVIGWLFCLLAEILGVASFVGILTSIMHSISDMARPSDVNPDLGGELHTNGCEGYGADVLVVSGEWVYDSLHSGWNEIHPVRHCQKIWTWHGAWEFDIHVVKDKWCSAIADARSSLTHESQKKPENQWQIHPDIDGCDPTPIIE